MITWDLELEVSGDYTVLKRLAWLVSAILAVLLGGVSVLLLSDNALFALVDKVLPTITPYRITLKNPRVLWREGRLDIVTLQVHQPGSDGPPRLGSSRIELNSELTATDESMNYQFDLHADYERVQDFLGAIEQDA